MRFIVFRNRDKPLVFIETMHDTRPHLATGQLEIIQPAFHQRPDCADLRLRHARMHHHPGGLVNDREIVVFVNDIERNLLGNVAREGAALSASGFLRCARRPAASATVWRIVLDQNLFFGDELLRCARLIGYKLPTRNWSRRSGIVRRNGNKNWE